MAVLPLPPSGVLKSISFSGKVRYGRKLGGARAMTTRLANLAGGHSGFNPVISPVVPENRYTKIAAGTFEVPRLHLDRDIISGTYSRYTGNKIIAFKSGDISIEAWSSVDEDPKFTRRRKSRNKRRNSKGFILSKYRVYPTNHTGHGSFHSIQGALINFIQVSRRFSRNIKPWKY
jgi:hypothetical protein